jgi:riboflavin synthase
MFTGIIEEIGRLEATEPRGAGARLRIDAPFVAADLREGDSVSVSGVCLTVTGVRPGSFAADVSPETRRRSTLGSLHPGAHVNLERALQPNSRLGGHIVQGHVDGIGRILSLELLGDDNWWLRVEVPAELDRYLVFKGSLAVDGISLTIAAVEGNVVSVTIIPHTYESTTLKYHRAGESVNIETDVLAKYVEKMLQSYDLTSSAITVEKLREQGF